jgi:hypothetical protein
MRQDRLTRQWQSPTGSPWEETLCVWCGGRGRREEMKTEKVLARDLRAPRGRSAHLYIITKTITAVSCHYPPISPARFGPSTPKRKLGID